MQEPNYNLTDGNGNVIAQLGTNSNGDFIVEHSSGDQAVFNDDGLQVPAIDTAQATINNQPAEDPRELLTYVDASGSSFSETVEVNTNTPSPRYFVEVLNFEDQDSGGNTELQMTIEGAGSGDYDNLLLDETGTYDNSDGDDAFRLIVPTATTDFDRHAGRWFIHKAGAGNILGVVGDGAAIETQQGQSLQRGINTAGATQSTSADLIISYSNSDSATNIELAVWELQTRSAI